MKSIIRAKHKRLKKPIAFSNKLMTTVERQHIKAHLAFTELRLRLAQRNPNPARLHTLDNLHTYWKVGQFPVNTSVPNKRQPVFIDEYGTYCAVGWLMAQSGNAELANKINSANPYVLVEELNSDEAKNWLQQSGLSQTEASLIQPSYGYDIERTSYSLLEWAAGLLSLILMTLITVSVGVLIYVIARRQSPIKNKRLKVDLAILGVIIGVLCMKFLPLPGPVDTFHLVTNDSFNKYNTIYCPSREMLVGADGTIVDHPVGVGGTTVDPEELKICESYEAGDAFHWRLRIPDCNPFCPPF